MCIRDRNLLEWSDEEKLHVLYCVLTTGVLDDQIIGVSYRKQQRKQRRKLLKESTECESGRAIREYKWVFAWFKNCILAHANVGFRSTSNPIDYSRPLHPDTIGIYDRNAELRLITS